MSRVGLVCSEPLRASMGGIGIRYLELARRLPAAGIEVLTVSAGDPVAVPQVPGGSASVRAFERGRLHDILAGCDAVVTQGQLANDVLLEVPELPSVVDLYDPWLVENLHYAESLGLDPYRNDHATWVLQQSRGDFFLCSCEEQRLYYLGFLTALGRVNPERLAQDPDLAGLVATVPFGVPRELPAHRPYLSTLPPEVLPVLPGARRILFGGLYDWYDPWTLLDALELLESRRPKAGRTEPWQLLVIETPNPDSTPQRLFRQLEERCRRNGWWGSRVVALPWVPADRRYDLLRDVDLMVAPHRPSLETRLSLRTRFLDALAAGCPPVTSEGGAISRLLTEQDAGWVVPPADPPALALTLAEILEDLDHRGELIADKRRGMETLSAQLAWDTVLEPLIAFLKQPRRDPTKDAFAFRPETVSPPDSAATKLKRKLGRALGRS